jgi:hypothetical protein
VYKKNKNEARTRRCREPQIPIIKNIGIKMLSNEIKNDTKSSEKNDKIEKISNKIK